MGRASSPSGIKAYKEVFVDRNTPTRTQTLKNGRGRKAGRERQEIDPKPRKPPETQGQCSQTGVSGGRQPPKGGGLVKGIENDFQRPFKRLLKMLLKGLV